GMGAEYSVCMVHGEGDDAHMTEPVQARHTATSILEQPNILRLSETPVLDSRTFHKPFVLNAGVAEYEDKIILLTRAQSADEPSAVWMAVLDSDGETLREAASKPVLGPGADCVISPYGVEDVRITRMRDGRYIITANSLWPDQQNPSWWLPQIAIAQTWDFAHFELIGFPFPGLRTKNSTLFPDTEHNERYMLHRVQPDIWMSRTTDVTLCHWPDAGQPIMTPRPKMINAGLMKWIGAGSQPILTDYGWLMVYHSGMWIDEDHGKKLYLLWLALLDRDDPSQVLAESDAPIYWPLLGQESGSEDWYSGVSFTCGAIVRDSDLWVYVTLNDSRIHLGKMPMREVWQILGHGEAATGA
ncbi:MAG TPA: hypothetical protein VHR86_06565, partial [Armatimonadota bacterium]|nr:hypothetical protein [Armatimonadota bacterium]